MVDLVWKSQQGKHEETVRVVYGLITDVVEDLPPLLLEALFRKIAEVPASQYSEMSLIVAHALKGAARWATRIV